MYASVRVYAGNPTFADALVEHESDVKALISGIQGFQAYYLIKTADGTASVSVYESQDGAEESNRAAAAWIVENLPQFAGTAAPQISSGEVVINA
jgi:heme-degrading monooxygenase HmoA